MMDSFHHQCVKKLGKGLRITATASDGVIEAIEADRPAFTAGVQWHPEVLFSLDPGMEKLFLTLTERAGSCLFPGSAG